jgi:hypothetical protein
MFDVVIDRQSFADWFPIGEIMLDCGIPHLDVVAGRISALSPGYDVWIHADFIDPDHIQGCPYRLCMPNVLPFLSTLYRKFLKGRAYPSLEAFSLRQTGRDYRIEGLGEFLELRERMSVYEGNMYAPFRQMEPWAHPGNLFLEFPCDKVMQKKIKAFTCDKRKAPYPGRNLFLVLNPDRTAESITGLSGIPYYEEGDTESLEKAYEQANLKMILNLPPSALTRPFPSLRPCVPSQRYLYLSEHIVKLLVRIPAPFKIAFHVSENIFYVRLHRLFLGKGGPLGYAFAATGFGY